MEDGAARSTGVVMAPADFSAFYRATLPEVYGYVLRLCAGDRSQAEDLTQDVWLALVRELRLGRSERADIRWLISVARTRFIDFARREQRRESKLQMLRWSEASVAELEIELGEAEVINGLANLQPLHRAVLVLRYVDGLTVPEVATLVGRNLTATNSLLARARAELRRSDHARAAGGRNDD